MRLSISSSDSSSEAHVPAAPYGRIWGLALIVFLALAGGTEWRLRASGHQPSVVDSSRFWAIHRDDVYTKNGIKRIVIAGASRSQTGLVPEVLEEFFPGYKVKHLAINGSPSFSVVRDLCDDPGFDGFVLWDISSESMIKDGSIASKDDTYVDFYRHDFQDGSSWDENLNCYLSAILQSRFVIFHPDFTLKRKVSYGFSFRIGNNFNMGFDRSRTVYYKSKMKEAQREFLRQRRIHRLSSQARRIPDEKTFADFLTQDLRPLYQKLRSRGGEMVMVRMPTTGEHLGLDEALAPKEVFWDRINGLTGIPTVHFLDYASLSGFDCPDTSHLDAGDAPVFTRNLSRIVLEINRLGHVPGK